MDKLTRAFGTKLQVNIPLSQYTTLQTGGPAKFFIAVDNEEDLIRAIKAALENNIPYLVIGQGSNLLISDKGFPGLIIRNRICGITITNNEVTASSGTVLQYLVNATIKSGLSGLHKLTGIPGTLGGAVYGNAGAYGQTISDRLIKIKAFDPLSDKTVTLLKDNCQFNYRDSVFKNNSLIILEASFELLASQGDGLRGEAEEILKQRLIKYPLNLKCPGSFFKNVPVEKIPPESLKLIPADKITYGKIPAGYLLEAVGAKGAREGRIEVSPIHGNLIVNLGEGTSADFYKLAKSLAQKVKDKFGITLEPEAQLINLPQI